MKSSTLFAMVAVAVTASTQARPTRQVDFELIEFALARDGAAGSQYFVLGSIGKIFERYGEKLAIVGRIVANIGDAMAGFGRWLQSKGPMPETNEAVRMALMGAAEELVQSTTSASREEELASKVVAAAFADIASEELIGAAIFQCLSSPNGHLDGHLVVRLHEIAARLIQAGESRGPVAPDEVSQQDIAIRVLKKIANQL